MNFTLDFFEALRRMGARRKAAKKPHNPAGEALSQGNIAHGGQIGPAGLALIKQFEGCARALGDGRFAAYPDPGSGSDPWTIGWGATGQGIASGTIWTQAECDARLERDLARFSREVTHALGSAPTSQVQFDALVSFHYNTGAIGRATLTKLHKAGKYAQAEAEFARWVHSGGKRLNGLVRRRKAEAALYCRG